MPRYTVADYQAWEGDWELWDGIAVSMSPSLFGPHQRLAARLLTALQNAIDSAGCEATALYEIDWIVSENTVIRPEIVVLCGAARQRHLERTPAIVAEILSPSTEHRDRNEKLELYQEQRVRDHLILHPERPTSALDPSGPELPTHKQQPIPDRRPC